MYLINLTIFFTCLFMQTLRATLSRARRWGQARLSIAWVMRDVSGFPSTQLGTWASVLQHVLWGHGI